MLHHRDSHNEQVRPSENYDRLSNWRWHLLLRLYWALQQARFVLHLCTSPASSVLGSSTSQVCITPLYISCFVCTGLFNKPGLYYTFVHLLLRLYWALQQARFVLHLCTSPASSVLGSSTSQVCITPLYISCFVCTGLFNKPGLYYTFVHLLLRLYWALQQARFVLHLCTSQFQRRIFRCVESCRDWTSSSIGPLLLVGYVRDSVCYQHVLVVHKAHLIVLLFSCIYILYGTLVAKRSKMHSFCMPVLTKGSRGSVRTKPF